MKPRLIVNPASASGRTGKHFDAIARAVQGALGECDWVFTRTRGDGAVLAREAALSGSRLVIAVGGDGTASEVIDGLLANGSAPPEVAFGFIPRGSGGDLRRTLGYPEDVAEAARVLASGETRACDVGVLEYLDPTGRRRHRHFANVAGFGVAGVVVQEAERGWKAFGGKLGFMLASAKGLMRYADQPVRFRLDGGPWQEERVTSVSICNGRYFGGGMLVAPEARMDDGLLDVTVWKGLGFGDFITKKRMLYDGSHVKLPNTRTARARVVEAEPLDGAKVLLDCDGEQPGTLPARFTLLPGALRIVVPSPPGRGPG